LLKNKAQTALSKCAARAFGLSAALRASPTTFSAGTSAAITNAGKSRRNEKKFSQRRLYFFLIIGAIILIAAIAILVKRKKRRS